MSEVLFVKFSDHIKGSLSFKNGDESVSGLVPMLSFTYGIAIISQGASFGVAQDNKNRRITPVYLFMPQQASVMLDAMVACFNGSHIKKVEIFNIISINDKTYSSIKYEFQHCYPIAFTAYTKDQYESIISKSVDIKVEEHIELMSLATQYKSGINWYNKYVSYTGQTSLMSPGQADVIMMAYSFLNLNVKAAKFKDNKITGYDGGNIDK